MAAETRLDPYRVGRFKRPYGRVTWGWRLRYRNGKILATDGRQDYANGPEALEIGTRVVTGRYTVDVDPDHVVSDPG